MPGQASSVPRSAIRRPGSLTYARCTDARLLRTLFRLDRRGLPCPLRLSPTQSRSPQQPPAKAPTALAGGDNNDEDGDEDDDDNSNDSDTTTTAREQGDSARQHHSFAGSLSRAAASSTTADTSHTAVPFCSLPARPSPSSLSRVPLAGPCHWPRHPAARTSQQTPAVSITSHGAISLPRLTSVRVVRNNPPHSVRSNRRASRINTCLASASDMPPRPAASLPRSSPAVAVPARPDGPPACRPPTRRSRHDH
ncbi:hypothetical protein AcW1_009240 [Taiwanofungus camphoratus]|nr:hypothetical protein AcW1_009240 [Antrodia cinnamomea]